MGIKSIDANGLEGSPTRDWETKNRPEGPDRCLLYEFHQPLPVQDPDPLSGHAEDPFV